MTKIPDSQHSISSLIDQYHEQQAERVPLRPHLGCSQLGHPCDRWLWLSFRWAVRQQMPGRLLRLFRRGKMEEATVIADLRAIGIDVRCTGENQARVEFGAHLAGSADGIIESGVPEAQKKRHVLEIKTHNKASFDELERAGVEKAKPEHWVQMQLYMHGLKIDRALYIAVCKDDDRLYTERVRYDKAVAERYIERGRRIALSDRMPEPISADPSWYQCKMCPAHAFCHETHLTDQVNCRTCAHSTPKADSTWRCERFDADGIPVEFQRQGCECHVLHPDLVPWQLKDGPDRWTACYEIDSVLVQNGEPDGRTFASKELVANPQACAHADDFITEVREVFDARISG